jgi:hypothetical protein
MAEWKAGGGEKVQVEEADDKEIIKQQANLLQAICKRRDEVRNQPQLLNRLAQQLLQRWSSNEKDSKAERALDAFIRFMLQADSLPCEFIGA